MATAASTMASQLKSNFASSLTRGLVTPKGISGAPLRVLPSRRKSCFTIKAVQSEKAPQPRNHSFIPRATTEEDSSSSSETSADLDDNFEGRLSEVRLRYRSGTGKKAELRKTRKGKKIGSGMGSSIYLPPVPLKEPISEGLNVEFGFSPFSERVNGRIAILGLSALFLVELATGKGVINYHSPPIVLIQVYFVAAVTALYLKYEKEKVSIWPEK